VSSANPVTNQQAAFSAPPGYPFPMYQPGYPSGLYGGPQMPTGIPPSQPAPVAQSPSVIQDSSVQVEDTSKGKKSVRCWKCAVESHATKDCTAIHYCLVCNTGAHPTCRCPTLKLPKPLAYFTRTGNIDTLNLHLPDNVYKPHLVPSGVPTALVTVSGDSVSAKVIESQMARVCPGHAQWKWEAIPHGENAFTIAVPSADDLQCIDGM
jgi:hypothetical protein